MLTLMIRIFSLPSASLVTNARRFATSAPSRGRDAQPDSPQTTRRWLVIRAAWGHGQFYRARTHLRCGPGRAVASKRASATLPLPKLTSRLTWLMMMAAVTQCSAATPSLARSHHNSRLRRAAIREVIEDRPQARLRWSRRYQKRQSDTAAEHGPSRSAALALAATTVSDPRRWRRPELRVC